MSELHEDELVRRLERLGGLQPEPEAMRQALERIRRRLLTDPPTAPTRRPAVLLRRLAVAAAVLFAAGAILTWLVPAPAPARASFADVQAAMRAPRSVTCRQTSRVDGVIQETLRLLILGNGLCRAEEADGNYTLIDPAAHRTLLVLPKERKATLLQGANLPQVNFYELLKNLPGNASARALPGKKLDGKDVLGFVVKVQGHDLTAWADSQTHLPVRIEAEERDERGKTVTAVIDDFVFDKELDPRLFAFEAPPGYRLDKRGVAELPAAPADLQRKDLVVTPRVGIGPVKFGMARPEVEKLLGKPDAVEAVGKNGYVNLNYGSRGFFLGLSKTLGVVTISCVAQKVMATRVRDFAGKTDQGIALGAGKAAIVRAYGAPDRDDTNKGSTYLSYSKLQAHFTLFGDELVEMVFTRPRPAN
jgi:hypothetical protein